MRWQDRLCLRLRGFCGLLPVLALAAAAGPVAPDLAPLPMSAADLALIATLTAPPADFTRPERFEDRPGGGATVTLQGQQAFSQPSGNMAIDRDILFGKGHAIFTKIWVAAPAKTKASDGLGPLYNARSCESCHQRDGRGMAGGNHAPQGLILRLTGPSGTPDPIYGDQLQDRATPGQTAEYALGVSYDAVPFALSGADQAFLRQPTYQLMDLAYGPLTPGSFISPRIAPPMIGLGLLEAVPEAQIIALADPEDRDGNGISGRADRVGTGTIKTLGRFGHQVEAVSLRAQAAAALSMDMGLSSPDHPEVWGDCTAAQIPCRTAANGIDANGTVVVGGGSEIQPDTLDLLTFYSRNLGVPARRSPDDPAVLRGKSLFYAAGCPACHHPKFVTSRLPDQPEQSFQLIWPYSDLLLHDMGPALADPGPGRNAGEWRTAPLWGVGLTAVVSGQESYLHDGRALSLTEAILWHGGEATAATQAFIGLPPPDRALLIRFLQSL